MKTVAITWMLLLSLAACSADSNVDRTVDRTGWNRIDATYFTFDIPADMVKTRVAGIDSLVGEYKNSQIRLSFDYGSYSDPLKYDKRLPQYQSSEMQVDGRKARMVTFRQSEAWLTAIHFPNAGQTSGEPAKLTIHAACETAEGLQVARAIFTSVHIK